MASVLPKQLLAVKQEVAAECPSHSLHLPRAEGPLETLWDDEVGGKVGVGEQRPHGIKHGNSYF